MSLCGFEPLRLWLLAPIGTMDIELLRRFVLGECDPAERKAIARWLEDEPARERLLEAVRQMIADPGAWTQTFDARGAWARLVRVLRLSGRRERVVRVRHAPVRASFHTSRRGAAAGARRRMAVWSLAAAATITLGVRMAWRPLRQTLSGPAVAMVMREIVVPRGERAMLTLSDGTRVQLAAGSRLSYPATFGDGVRAVTLDGEAYFEVRHDAKRAFEVRTRGGVARDVGTAFVVRQYGDDARVEVVVAEGRVAVRARLHGAAGAREVDAGQLVRIDSVGHADVRTVDPASYLAWMQGRLVFDDAPFREVLAELSRWYDADFRLADTTLASRRFTGVFVAEPLDSVLSALAPPMHVRFERRGRVILFSRLPGER